NTVELNDSQSTQLTADKFLIATGSKIKRHAFANLDTIPYLTSDDILELETAPKSIVVLGGGFIACELAQFLNRIGVQVTIIQRSPHLLTNIPEDASRVLEDVFKESGITVYTHTELENIELVDNEVSVIFKHNGKAVNCRAEKVFNALGRSPNTQNLGLENIGVHLRKTGHIETNDYQQTTNPSIYAAGDCASRIEIVHVAILQGECAAKHAFTGTAEPINYNDLVQIIFTDPQIAIAGILESDLIKRGANYLTASYPFDDHGKSILMKAKWGYVKIFADAITGKILGAECVGKDASELIHSIAVGITLNATVFDLLKTHWYHPTLSEIWAYPLEEIAEQIKK
ncbi:MAG: pyridine nucleotide-disulfide oxidoreductase, partial [Verrucomicrobia bacterium CG_4_10_14_3_um_filter_43_23]